MRKELREAKNLPEVTQRISLELGLEDRTVKLQSVSGPCILSLNNSGLQVFRPGSVDRMWAPVTRIDSRSGVGTFGERERMNGIGCVC